MKNYRVIVTTKHTNRQKEYYVKGATPVDALATLITRRPGNHEVEINWFIELLPGEIL